jgi:hypothetical protein
MNRFVLQKRFYKSIHLLVFNKYVYKNKKSKLYFEYRVAVINDIFYEYGGSNNLKKQKLIASIRQKIWCLGRQVICA